MPRLVRWARRGARRPTGETQFGQQGARVSGVNALDSSRSYRSPCRARAEVDSRCGHSCTSASGRLGSGRPCPPRVFSGPSRIAHGQLFRRKPPGTPAPVRLMGAMARGLAQAHPARYRGSRPMPSAIPGRRRIVVPVADGQAVAVAAAPQRAFDRGAEPDRGIPRSCIDSPSICHATALALPTLEFVMQIRYIGHASICIEAAGTRVLLRSMVERAGVHRPVVSVSAAGTRRGRCVARLRLSLARPRRPPAHSDSGHRFRAPRH